MTRPGLQLYSVRLCGSAYVVWKGRGSPGWVQGRPIGRDSQTMTEQRLDCLYISTVCLLLEFVAGPQAIDL